MKTNNINEQNSVGFQKTKALKALELAKKNEANKKGKYVRLDSKTIVFRPC